VRGDPLGTVSERAWWSLERVRAAQEAPEGGPAPAARLAGRLPLWIERQRFLDALGELARPEAAGEAVWAASEPWVRAVLDLATPDERLAEVADWAALIDRHSVVEIASAGEAATRVVWSEPRPGEAKPAECAFRLGVLEALLGGAGGARGVLHRECAARGARACVFNVLGLAPRDSPVHARALREASLLAAAQETQEEIFRRLAAHSPLLDPLPDPRELRAVRRFMEELEDLIVIFDRSLRVLDANRAAVEFSGLSRTELVGLSARDLVSADSYRLVRRTLPLLLRRGAVRGLRLEGRSRSGWAPLEISARVSEHGETLVTLARDVSRHLHLERELESRNLELRQLSERIRELDLLKSEFLANVSHELTTPLTCIQGFARLLRRDVDQEIRGGPPQLATDQRLDFLKRVQSEAQRMGDLIGGVLELSKIESGVVTLDRSRLSLNRLARECALLLKPRLEDEGIELGLDLAADLPEAPLDPERIKQAVLNLIDNAIKFSRAGSRIELCTRARKGALELSVSNPAHELEPAHLERIFGRFVQRDGSSRRQRGGVGLGLNLVRAIVELHGGKVWAELRSGRVTFIALLPG
jgi:PAS domain S-box-containing protein